MIERMVVRSSEFGEVIHPTLNSRPPEVAVTPNSSEAKPSVLPIIELLGPRLYERALL